MGDETVMQRLARAFPAEVVKVKPGRGGSKPLSYISHALVTERLNEVDPGWTWRVLTEHLYYDQGGAPHCAGVTVEMTVNGVSRVEAGGPQRQDGFTNEIKNAYSDAIKRAAMRFGVALYIWDSLVDAQDDDDARGEPDRQLEPRERAAVEERHARNAEPPPPMRLPATRKERSPDEKERVRRDLIAKAAEKGIVIPEGATAGEWVGALDSAFEILDMDFRVDAPNGVPTTAALYNAIAALPALRKEGGA